MADQYAGDPNNFPEDFTLPDDSNPPTAAEFNVGFEALGDRTAWLRDKLTSIATVDFPGPATIDVPEGATHAIVEGWGGGGGGGAGGDSAQSTVAHSSSCGGGGGGGAERRLIVVAVTAGSSLAGALGTGGPGGTSAGIGKGGAGGDTTLTRVSDSVVIARFRGAGGGLEGATEVKSYVNFDGISDTPIYAIAPGGQPVAQALNDFTTGSGTLYRHMYRSASPQAGGRGLCRRAGASSHIYGQGNSSPWGTSGGHGGNVGLDGGIMFGGGSGGGGGAGPGGNGGDGGNGTTGSESVSTVDGGAGEAAAALSGAGGGGGGSAGGSPVPGGKGGSGGGGGSGWLRITFIRRGDV